MWHTQGLSLGHSGRPCPPEEGVQRSAVNGEKGDSKVVAVDTRFTDNSFDLSARTAWPALSGCSWQRDAGGKCGYFDCAAYG